MTPQRRSTDFDTCHGIHPGKHFYQFYKNKRDYFEVMTAYFQAGLEKGEACLWLVSRKMGVEEACDFADKKIQHCLFYLSSGQLQIRSAEGWYLSNGSFDQEKALANAQATVDGLVKKGFHLIRAAGDAGAIPQRDWSKLYAYEEKISPWIRSAPLVALCAYPILECSLPDTKSVLEHHDSVLVGHH